MKNTNKKILTKDPMAEAKKDKDFLRHSEAAKVRIKFAVEVFKVREENGLTQQALAKMIGTTQKVVSKVENADVNIGIDLLNRIMKNLNFTSENLAEIFDCPILVLYPRLSETKSRVSETKSRVWQSN
ncbi:helix-turn-helix transcriptional regulator [Patescibacteria group bacterium]|nr:helix-turn-helix transcriptional regulator [Patescibacteria group bacterium]